MPLFEVFYYRIFIPEVTCYSYLESCFKTVQLINKSKSTNTLSHLLLSIVMSMNIHGPMCEELHELYCNIVYTNVSPYNTYCNIV